MNASPENPVLARVRCCRHAAWVAFALTLGACAGAPAEPRPAPPPQAASAPQSEAPAPPVVAETPAPAASREAAVPATESVATGDVAPAPAAATERKVAARPPQPARAEPRRLSGLSGGEVAALIGAPQFLRVDDPAAMWQYQSGACVLDLFLYADGPVYRVRHYAFRSDPRARRDGAAAPVDPGACLARLIAARKGLKS